LSKLIGVPPAGLGKLLEPIQSFCILERLPPLTILVVQTSTGLPGTGFTAASASEYAKAHMKVFRFDWLDYGNPGPERLEQAVQRLPSNG
jgi:hypothetical protein